MVARCGLAAQRNAQSSLAGSIHDRAFDCQVVKSLNWISKRLKILLYSDGLHSIARAFCQRHERALEVKFFLAEFLEPDSVINEKLG